MCTGKSAAIYFSGDFSVVQSYPHDAECLAMLPAGVGAGNVRSGGENLPNQRTGKLVQERVTEVPTSFPAAHGILSGAP